MLHLDDSHGIGCRNRSTDPSNACMEFCDMELIRIRLQSPFRIGLRLSLAALAIGTVMIACSNKAPGVQVRGKLTTAGTEPLLNAKVTIAPYWLQSGPRKWVGIPPTLDLATTWPDTDGNYLLDVPAAEEYFVLVEHEACGDGGNLQIVNGCRASCVRDLHIDPSDCD